MQADIIIEKRCIGRILGKGARDLDAMKAYSGAEIFIIDKHPPPDEGDDRRLLALITAEPGRAARRRWTRCSSARGRAGAAAAAALFRCAPAAVPGSHSGSARAGTWAAGMRVAGRRKLAREGRVL